MKWDLSVQEELPGNSLLEVAYLGNHMSHLEMDWDPNMPPDSPNVPISTSFNSIRPNPGLGSVANYLESFGYGNFAGFSVSYQKRLSHGLQFQGVYTWSHVIAAAPMGPWALGYGVGSPEARNMGGIYSSPPWDIRHNFVGSFIYELPFGKGKKFGNSWSGPLNSVLGNWQLNGLITSYRALRYFDHGKWCGIFRLRCWGQPYLCIGIARAQLKRSSSRR